MAQNVIIEPHARPDGGEHRIYCGKCEGRWFHIAGDVSADGTEFTIVTVYCPDPKKWTNSYRERRAT